MLSDDAALAWEQAYTRLVFWAAEHGHARVPQKYVAPDGFRLGKWIHNQRTTYRMQIQGAPTHRMSDDRIAALEQVPGWVWNTHRPKPVASEDSVAATPLPRQPRGRHYRRDPDAPPQGFISTAVFDRACESAVATRALDRWLRERQSAGWCGEFSEESLRADEQFRGLMGQERVRLGLAALVATGEVTADLGSPESPLSWQSIVSTLDMDPQWRFTRDDAAVSQRLVPVEVLSVYLEETDRLVG